MTVTVGIDVGGSARGFHAVAFQKGRYHGKLHSRDEKTLVLWCDELNAQAVGVDAPCCWSATGRARLAERELMAERISCFSTPSIETAKLHASNYFGWMLNGAKLFSALLSSRYQLFNGNVKARCPTCFETFPQAIACALAGEVVSAKRKRQLRRELLERNGIDTAPLTNIDWLDAALCALTAHRVVIGPVRTYGDLAEGFIVVPG
jgi:predicted nuclease with RNAse H fold